MRNDILYVVMPAYNEEANIASVVKQWHSVVQKTGPESRLLIINDGSKDSTFKKLEGLREAYPLLVPIDKSNSGHGSTLLFAYREAINKKADYIFQTDSDGQTNPDEFWVFWDNRTEYDFQIGERTARKDGVLRVFVTKVLQLIVLAIFGKWIKDPNTPYRLMKLDFLKNVLTFIPENFFLCNVAISTIAIKREYTCIWRPVSFKAREEGINSINLKRIIKIGFKSLGDFRIIKKNLDKR